MDVTDGGTRRPEWVARLADALGAGGDEIYRPALDLLREAGRWPAAPAAEAAVLVPIVESGRGPELLLTRRRDDLMRHAGQVAFPGGIRDPGDVGPEATALREAEEEIALPPASVGVLGRLPRYPTTTGYLVTPVVGYVERPVELHAAPEEVADIFTVPLPVLLDESRWHRRFLEFEGMRLPFLEIHWGGQRIWGATAGMLRLLVPLLREAREAA